MECQKYRWLTAMRRRKPVMAGCGILAAAVIIAGCGSSASPSASTKSVTSASTNAASSSSSSAAGSSSSASAPAVVARCNSLIAEYEGKPQFTPPGPAISAAKLKGKTIAIISVEQAIPTLAEAATAMEQAAAAAGLKTTLYNAESNPSRMVQGMHQAINEHAGAAILLGIPAELVPGPIKSLKEAGIPSVSVLNNDPVKGVSGQGSPDKEIYATSAPSYSIAGELEGCTAVLKTKAEATVAIMSTPDITPAKFVVEGAKKVLGECSGCEVKAVTETPLAKWSSELAGETQSILRKNPEINYLIPVLDDMALYAATGVRQSATKVPIATFNGTPAVLSLVQKGNVVTADPGEDNIWIGWHAVDQAMRGMLKLEPADPAVPIRYFDQSNLSGLNVKEVTALYGTSFIPGYKKLWGVG